MSRTPRRHATRASAVVAAVAAAAACAGSPTAARGVTTLTFDPSRTGVNVVNAGGTWDAQVANANWSPGTLQADVPWPNNAATDASIGSPLALGSATVALGSDLQAEGVAVSGMAANLSSFTLDGAGHTLTVAATTSYGMDVTGTSLTLTNGSFVLGGPSGPANTAALGVARVLGGATLTLGAGSTLAAAVIQGDGSAGDAVRFDGGTYRPLANVDAIITATASGTVYQYYPQVLGVTNTYVAAGGLTVDTRVVVGGSTTRFAAFTQDILHDPALGTTADGGLTQTGGGVLNLGYFATNPTFSYTGPTTVDSGILVLYSNANANAAGPFPNTRFVVNAGGQVNVFATNGLAGATGTTPVTINGGSVSTFDGLSVHLADVTMTGGYLASFKTAAGATGNGTFTFGGGAELHAVAATTATAASPTVATVRSAFVTPEAGSDLRVDANAELDVTANVVDDAAGPGQLTVNGAGTVVLYGGANGYTGGTTVNGGTLRVGYTAATGPARLTGTKTLTVAAGGAVLDGGVIASVPAATVNGSLSLVAYPGPTVAEVTTLASLAVGGSAVGAAVNNGQVNLVSSAAGTPRVLLVTGSLAFAGTTGAWYGRLDLGTNDLDVQNGSLAQLTNQIATAYNGGSYAGNGIYSSAAAADVRRVTAVGVVGNADGSGGRLFGSGTAQGLFDGTDPAAGDVLVRYTYYGDANLDGKVDGQDYGRIDAGYASRSAGMPLTGWYNGDFNYDGTVDGSDYTLIDNAFNLQGAPLAPAVVAEATSELAPAGAAAVPEPGAIGLLAVAALGVARRRRRTA